MLLSYKASNFGSFKEDFEFSMKPIRFIPRFEDNIIFYNDKIKVSKFAVIAGENTGGKTSFIESLDFLKYCILESNRPSMIKTLTHRYNSDSIQKFELSILADDKIYNYKLQIDKYYIVFESLSFKDLNKSNSRYENVFTVKRNILKDDINQESFSLEMEYSVKNKFIPKEIATITENLNNLNNKNIPSSFINYLYRLNVEIVKPFIKWIDSKLIIKLPKNANLNVYESMKNNLFDLEIMKTDEFLELLQLMDCSIVNIELSESEVYEKTIITRKTGNGEEFKIKLENESSGMRSYFAWAVYLWKVIYKDAVLFADEIDSLLNPILTSRIIAFLRGSDTKGQFIFSTHNVLNLNTKDFMKEQIYFVSKDLDTLSSTLYSLKDFKNYRYEKSNVYELYLKGILGGVPN